MEGHLAEAIGQLVARTWQFSWVYYPHRVNGYPQNLAKYVLSCNGFEIWLEEAPNWLSLALVFYLN